MHRDLTQKHSPSPPTAKNNIHSPLSFLFIGFVWPEINATAASQNIISYMNTFVSLGHAVHFASASQKSPLSTELSTLGIHSHDITLNCDSFDSFVGDLRPDIVIFDRFLSEEQFGWRVMRAAPNAMRVLDCEDLHFLRHARHGLYKQTGYQSAFNGQAVSYLQCDEILKEQHRHLLYSELCTRELASIYRCDLSIVLSRQELHLLHAHFNVPEHALTHVPFIGETLALKETAADSSATETKTSQTQGHVEKVPLALPTRHDFISIGNFRHAPNIDAVNILIQKIWPKIRKVLSDAELHIYGAYCPPKIQAFHAPKNGLYIHGHVPNHIEVLSHARVLLAPIQFGAGVKGKLRDALLCSLPSITSPIGAEGIDYQTWPGGIANTENEFVEQAIRIYQLSEAEYQKECAKCEAIVADNFDAPINREHLAASVLQGFSSLKEQRQANFMQQMMSHHTLQSHKYMSQWIAAKNKL